MVQWDSKERGVRLDECRGVRGVYLGCTPCHRSVGVELAEAMRVFGADTFLGDIARRLKCTECGERKGYVMVWANTSPR